MHNEPLHVFVLSLLACAHADFKDSVDFVQSYSHPTHPQHHHNRLDHHHHHDHHHDQDHHHQYDHHHPHDHQHPHHQYRHRHHHHKKKADQVPNITNSTSNDGSGLGRFKCDKKNRAPCAKVGTNERSLRGCGKNDMRCDQSQWEHSSPKKGKFIPCCEKQNLFGLLEFVDSVLAGQVEYGLFWGTLLGAVRDEDLIDWDTDVDIVIKEDDRQKAFDLISARAGDYGRMDSDSMGRTFLNFGLNNHIHIDIWHASFKGGCAFIHDVRFPAGWVESLGASKCKIQGQDFPCPDDAKRLLDYIYPSWSTKQGNRKAVLRPRDTCNEGCCEHNNMLRPAKTGEGDLDETEDNF